MLQVKTALISVWDKTGIVELAQGLSDLGITILSTGGTARKLEEANVPLVQVSDYTGSKELLQGRVKTLHPKIHAGLLAVRDNPEHMQALHAEGIRPIDMVVVNLYPFREIALSTEHTVDTALAHIDIGGPCMLRAGAKNFHHVVVVSHPRQYSQVLEELQRHEGAIHEDMSARLAEAVFQTTSYYDATIADYLQRDTGISFPERFTCAFHKKSELRYGENPHQRASFYEQWRMPVSSIPAAEQLGGGELSFNNVLDFEAARRIVAEFSAAFCVVIKHNNPCGAATASTLPEACESAFAGDPTSAFGSIVGVNEVLNEKTATLLATSDKFIQGIIAPAYTAEAIRILQQGQPWGKRLIILRAPQGSHDGGNLEFRFVHGGMLVQEQDTQTHEQAKLKCVTEREPTAAEDAALEFAWRICKHVKSNAIVLCRDQAVVGIGAGQMSRIDATEIAIRKAAERCQESVLASDAFFPFPDVVERAAAAGITAIIQPGGSIRDRDSIAAANEHGIVMLFTSMRHFLH